MSDSTDRDPFIGYLLANKYQIVRRIGHGGMGTVYQGTHVLMERAVAIKVVHTRLVEADAARLCRFHLEAKAASCLSHPNIIAIFDFGIAKSGLSYLVMDFVDGEGLDARFHRERTLGAQTAIQLFSQIVDGLAHAHDRGIVHRDLKPSNIMIVKEASGQERVKIVDFGIAKVMHNQPQLLTYSPRESQVIGSPLYMSPEQCLGDKSLDGRSDIYSLGCLLYQALSGRTPFYEETVLGIIYAHINHTPAPLAAVNPAVKVPAGLEAVVMKALNKDPAARQQSMRELLKELQQVSAATETPELPPAAMAGPKAFLKKLSDVEAGSSHVVPPVHDLTDFYLENKQLDRAEENLKQDVSCMVKRYSAWDLRAAEAVKKLADFYRSHGRFQEAEPLYEDLLSIKQEALGSNHPDIPFVLLRLAEVACNTSKHEEALRYYIRCLQLSEQIFGINDPILSPILTGLGATLRRLSREPEAELAFQRAWCLEETLFPTACRTGLRT